MCSLIMCTYFSSFSISLGCIPSEWTLQFRNVVTHLPPVFCFQSILKKRFSVVWISLQSFSTLHLYTQQFGLWKGDHVSSKFSQPWFHCITILDFFALLTLSISTSKKAFDSIPHGQLLMKLYGNLVLFTNYADLELSFFQTLMHLHQGDAWLHNFCPWLLEFHRGDQLKGFNVDLPNLFWIIMLLITNWHKSTSSALFMVRAYGHHVSD